MLLTKAKKDRASQKKFPVFNDQPGYADTHRQVNNVVNIIGSGRACSSFFFRIAFCLAP
jgi:hypothetical protein